MGLGAFKGQLVYQFSQAKDFTGNVLDENPALMSGLNARDIRVSIRQGERRLIEHHVIARKGMTLYDVCTDELSGEEGNLVEPTCASDFSFFRNHLALPH
jgi:hypothetical protein